MVNNGSGGSDEYRLNGGEDYVLLDSHLEDTAAFIRREGSWGRMRLQRKK